LLTAAVVHFRVFARLAGGSMSVVEMRHHLELAERPACVLLTALKAMGLIVQDKSGFLDLSPLARGHLTPASPFDISAYIGLSADSPEVVEMVERLRSNRPAGARPDQTEAAFIYREGIESAMEEEAAARHLTLALAGRAKIVAPVLAGQVPLDQARLLLDVGGGTGIYSIACLEKYSQLRAIVWDRPQVLKVAREFAARYGFQDRLECRPGDMFTDPVPEGCDVHLLSNVLHDWDVLQCRALVRRCADALPPGGRLLIHDVFLNDGLDGPLPVALYSAALFRLTEGRAYSEAEYRGWVAEAGLVPETVVPTLIHCGVLTGTKNRIRKD
jgi:SAM-dependent methyltransferase